MQVADDDDVVCAAEAVNTVDPLTLQPLGVTEGRCLSAPIIHARAHTRTHARTCAHAHAHAHAHVRMHMHMHNVWLYVCVYAYI
jgi:hypothetical protein